MRLIPTSQRYETEYNEKKMKQKFVYNYVDEIVVVAGI